MAPGGSMHQLSAVANCPKARPDRPPDDVPATSGRSWAGTCTSTTRTSTSTRRSGPKPFRFEWHQDGGRQNREIETDPRPRLSVKFAYWLSDVSETGRGNFKVVPGSHRRTGSPGRRGATSSGPTRRRDRGDRQAR